MAYIGPIGSTVAYQGTVPWSVLGATTNVGSVISVQQGSVATVIIGGSIAASFTPPANQSVSGTVGASLIGLSPVSVSNFPVQSGSVVAFQGTTPWVVSQNGSIAAVIIGGSIAASFTPPANQSVSGTVGASLIGLSPVAVSNFPTTQNVSGSVVSFQGGTQITSLVSTVPSSVLVGTSIFGQLPAGTAVLGSIAALQGTNPWIVVSSLAGGIFPISGSVAAVVTNSVNVNGSVVATQGTTPWVVNFQNSSILAVPVGSTQTIWQSPSIVGTYAEDSAHTDGQRGLFTLGVRNDTVSSFSGANLDYGPIATDSAGRTLIKPFAAGESSLIFSTSLVSSGTTASVAVFPAPGAGLRNYITDFNISNTSATTTIVRFADRDTSIIAQTIAPGGGGSNHSYATPPTGPTAALATGVQLVTSASVVYITVTGFKGP